MEAHDKTSFVLFSARMAHLARTNANVGPGTFYHGTSIECAMKIQVYGFDISLSGTSSGELLGPGVYCTPVLMKAVDYAKSKPFHGVILELRCDLGNCKMLLPCDPMMKTWQQHNFDSACMPNGANDRNMAETCIKDASRITVVRVIAGNTWQLERLGMCVRASDGRLSMIGDEAVKEGSLVMQRRRIVDSNGPTDTDVVMLDSPPASKRKRQDVFEYDAKTPFELLLRKWKLQGVEDILKNEGVIDETALMDDLETEDINQLDIGTVFKRRLHRLVQHLSAQVSRRQKLTLEGLELVDKMRKASKNADALMRASQTLLLLLGSDNDVIGAVVEDRILIVLISAMSHTRDLELQKILFALVALVLAHDTVIVVECLEIVPAVLTSMTENTKDEVLIVRGMAILIALLMDKRRTKAILEKFMDCDGLCLIMKIMGIHLGHFGLQSDMCQLLRVLASVPAFLVDIIRAGGLQKVTCAMSRHWKLAEKHEVGWRLLVGMISSTPKNIPMIIEKDGVGVLVQLLGQRKKDRKLQERGNLLLVVLARDNYATFTNKLVSADGVKIMVEVMKTHSADGNLLSSCMTILNTLCLLSENRSAIVAAGAFDITLLAMTMPETRTHTRMLACASQFILNLSASDNLRIMMIEAGIVPLLMTTMLAQKHVSLNQEHSIGAFYNLCADKNVYRLLFVQKGGISALLDAMTLHPLVARLQQISCAFLGYIARDVLGRADIVAKGGIPLVLSAMKTYAAIVPVQINIVTILNKIVFQDTHFQEVVLTAGALPLIILCMVTHKDHAALQLETFRFLHHLSSHPSHLHSFLNFEAIPALMAAMSVHIADIIVRDLAIEILFKLSTSDRNMQEQLKKSGAVLMMSKIITNTDLGEKFNNMAQKFLDTMASV